MTPSEICFNAICNEIDIDKDVLMRLGKTDLGFMPVRPMKTLPFIEKYHLTRWVYVLLAVFFLLLIPAFFFYKFLKSLKHQKENVVNEAKQGLSLVLVANSRMIPLIEKVDVNEPRFFLNLNQSNLHGTCHAYSLLSMVEKMKIYIYSTVVAWRIACRLEYQSDILQVYVVYDWCLTFFALNKIKRQFKKVYFSNHYDRWAVLFDNVFAAHDIHLLQHGVLPENLDLSYKLPNVGSIYVIDEKSMSQFMQLYDRQDFKFKKINMTLTLSDTSSLKPTVLLIGQPHSMRLELDIIDHLTTDDKCDVYIKPHPLFSDLAYRSVLNTILIEDKNFFPYVDVAVSFESTLGVEYENSGIPVVWMKGKKEADIVQMIKALIY